MLYLDEQMSIFLYRKMLKVFFRTKDKTSDKVELSIINSFIKETKNEINEIFVKANSRKEEEE